MALQVDFSDVFRNLSQQVVSLARGSFKEFKEDAVKDGLTLLNSMEQKLVRWTEALAMGELSKEDFDWLVKSQKGLAEMTALKRAGLGAIKLDQFKNNVLNLVTETISSVVKV